jgi:hypothetical protein
MKQAFSGNIGIGDLIIVRGFLEPVRHLYEEIRVSNQMLALNYWRKGDRLYWDFINQFGALVYSEKPFVFDTRQYRFNEQIGILRDFKVPGVPRPNLGHLLCKGPSLNIGDYIVLTTKVRMIVDDQLIPMLPQLAQVLNDSPYKIVVMGEREVERGLEYSVNNNMKEVFTIYPHIIPLLSKEKVIDLTVPALGVTAPQLDKLQADCQIMKEAKAVITMGLAGNFCIALATSNIIGYRDDHTKEQEHIDKMVSQNNIMVSKNWEQFLIYIKSV